MADIDVVKKGSTTWIVWLIVAVALLLVLWVVFGNRSSGRADTVGRAHLPSAGALQVMSVNGGAANVHRG